MIRVFIVDEVRLTCDILTAVLKEKSDIEVVGWATTVDEAMPQLSECDIVLVTTTLSKDGAYELTHIVTKNNLSPKVLIMGMTESREAIIRYIEAGAAGYVHRQDAVDRLLANIRAAYNDEAIVSPGIAAAIMARLAQLAASPMTAPLRQELADSAELTKREREVLNLIKQNFSNREIANYLTIEIGTVKNHVHNILEKLSLNNRRDAAIYWSMAGRN
jgi:two-component system, NarL family, nitrate/nitrite response regulator NarL